MLDLVQKSLDQEGYCYQRLDGTMDLESRREAVDQFSGDPGVTVMLASISSAGEGLVTRYVMIYEAIN